MRKLNCSKPYTQRLCTFIVVSWYKFAVSLNESESALVELPNEAILANVSGFLVEAGTELQMRINVSK